MPKDRQLIVESLGLMPYEIVWQQQKNRVAARKQVPALDDLLILTEHFPVYTLGAGAQTEFVHFELDDPAYEIHRVERGGEVTYHCPGQLVGYPIFNLCHYRKDLHWYLRQLEAVVIRTLTHYGLMGEQIEGLTGVWVDGYKVAAIGIKVSRWVTMHGLGLNVCPDLAGFQRITPCGIVDRPVGTMAQFLPDITVAQVMPVLIDAFVEVFGFTEVVETKGPPIQEAGLEI